MSRSTLLLASTLAASTLVGSIMLAGGCVTKTDEEPLLFSCPSAEEWPIVSQVVERKCGTLDCHGDRGRPFRLFGRNGVRLAPTDVVGSDFNGTTPRELDENRASACGLEPEKMAEVVDADAAIESLTLVRKPLLLEAHKGGRVWLEDSPGFVCLSSWLEGATDEDACRTELRIP